MKSYFLKRSAHFFLVFLLSFTWIFSGWPKIPFLGFPPDVPKTHAADGDIGVFREATGVDLINTTVTDIDWDTTVTSDTAYTLQGNNIDIDLADAGHYLVLHSVITDTASGSNRSEMQSWIRNNTSGTNLVYGRGQGYIRRSSGTDEGYNQGAAIIDVSAGDDIRLQMQRTDTNSATVQRRANGSGINFLKLDDTWNYLMSRPSSNQTIGSTTNFEDVTLATDDEIDAGSFSRSGSAITLKDTGHYLVTYNVGIFHTSGSIRINDETRLVIDNGTPIEIDGTRVTTYMRGTDGTQDGMTAWSGIINASANDVLKLQVRRESEVDSSGHIIKSAETGITIAKLPEGADYVRIGEIVGGQDMSTSQTAISWDETLEEDTASLDHDNTNTERINVNTTDDYLFFHSMYAFRAAGNGTRETQLLQWRKNGSTTVEYGSSGQFNRGDNGSYDARTSGSSAGFIDSLVDTDYIELTQINETSNQTSTYQGNRMGLQGVNISSLFISSFPTTSQKHFRWRDDTTALNTGGGWRAAEDSNSVGIITNLNDTYRLRVEVANEGTGGESAARNYELQFGEKSTTCSAVSSWTGVANTADDFDMVTTTHMTEGQATTAGLLANSEAYTRINGEGRETADTTGSLGPLSASNYTELEYSFKATASSTPGGIYCFRLYDTNNSEVLDIYSVYPELTIGYIDTRQLHFRWRDDTTALNTSGGWLATEDNNGIGATDRSDSFRLRMAVANTGNKAEDSAKTYELQWGQKTSTCAAISTWTGVANTADDFDMVTTTHMTEGQATTAGLLANSEAYTRINGEGRETADTTGSLGPLSASNYTELEYSFKASSTIPLGISYCFRLYDTTAGSVLDGYDKYPEIKIRGGLKVQKIIGSITGVLSQTETIPETLGNTERAFLMFDFSGSSSSDERPDESTCTAYISSTSQITVEKSATGGTCIYAIYVVEAEQKEFIVRGRGTIALTTTDLSQTGTANNLSTIFDTSKVFVPGMMRSDGDASTEWNETYTTIELTDSTTVTAERAVNTGTDTSVDVRFEVVEWQYPGVTVQTKEKILTSLSTSYQTDTIDTAVTMNRAFLYATGRHTSDGLSQTSVETSLTSTTQVSFRRGGGTYDSVVRWWVIEFPPNTATVQRGTGSATTNDDIDITLPSPVDLDKSFPVDTITNSGTGTAFPRGRNRSDLETTTNLNLNNGYSGNTAYYAWQVIDASALIMPELNQDSFRVYNNADALQPTIALANEDVTLPYVQNTEVIRLRIGITLAEADLVASGQAFKLQYGEGDICSAIGTWNDVGGTASGNVWRGYDNTTPTDGTTVSSSLLSGLNALGSYIEENSTPVNPNQIDKDERGEWDFVLQNNGATGATHYCFRMVKSDGTLFDTYSEYAQVTTAYPYTWTAF